jgi:hypothetical protein
MIALPEIGYDCQECIPALPAMHSVQLKHMSASAEIHFVGEEYTPALPEVRFTQQKCTPALPAMHFFP